MISTGAVAGMKFKLELKFKSDSASDFDDLADDMRLLSLPCPALLLLLPSFLLLLDSPSTSELLFVILPLPLLSLRGWGWSLNLASRISSIMSLVLLFPDVNVLLLSSLLLFLVMKFTSQLTVFTVILPLSIGMPGLPVIVSLPVTGLLLSVIVPVIVPGVSEWKPTSPQSSGCLSGDSGSSGSDSGGRGEVLKALVRPAAAEAVGLLSAAAPMLLLLLP
jgi:hypothetical protein